MTDAPTGSLARLADRLHSYVRKVIFVPPAGQFQALNGLRGFSAFLVVCFHCGIFSGNFPLVTDGKAELNWFHLSINGFWVGLDVFFVLSGFLIGRILMSSLQRTGNVEFWSFFIRRSARIFPAYYLVLTLAIFWYIRLGMGSVKFFMGVGQWEDMLALSWQNYFYVVNYFFATQEPNAMGWAWSLCVEEHFYLILPWLLTATFLWTARGVRPAALITIMLLPFAGRAVQFALNPKIVLLEGFYYRSHNRFDEVLIGVVIAYFYVYHFDRFQSLCQRAGNRIWIVGLLLVGSVWIFGGLQERGLFAVVFQFHLMALGTGFLIVNCLFNRNRFTRFFESSFWYPFARVSYGTYLIHPYVLFWLIEVYKGITPATMGVPAFLALFAAVMSLTFLTASAMFLVVEHPLIEWGARLSRRFRKPAL